MDTVCAEPTTREIYQRNSSSCPLIFHSPAACCSRVCRTQAIQTWAAAGAFLYRWPSPCTARMTPPPSWKKILTLRVCTQDGPRLQLTAKSFRTGGLRLLSQGKGYNVPLLNDTPTKESSLLSLSRWHNLNRLTWAPILSCLAIDQVCVCVCVGGGCCCLESHPQGPLVPPEKSYLSPTKTTVAAQPLPVQRRKVVVTCTGDFSTRRSYQIWILWQPKLSKSKWAERRPRSSI